MQIITRRGDFLKIPILPDRLFCEGYTTSPSPCGRCFGTWHILYAVCCLLRRAICRRYRRSAWLLRGGRNKYILSAGLGAAAGYILTQDSISSLRLIAASVCAGVLARVMREFEKVRNGRLLPSCIAFLSCFCREWRCFLQTG